MVSSVRERERERENCNCIQSKLTMKIDQIKKSTPMTSLQSTISSGDALLFGCIGRCVQISKLINHDCKWLSIFIRFKQSERHWTEIAKECVNHRMTFSRRRVDGIYIPIKLLAIQLFASDKINGPFLLLIVCHNMYRMHTSRDGMESHGNDWFINHGRSNLLLLSPHSMLLLLLLSSCKASFVLCFLTCSSLI